jgi:hypothetical protein
LASLRRGLLRRLSEELLGTPQRNALRVDQVFSECPLLALKRCNHSPTPLIRKGVFSIEGDFESAREAAVVLLNSWTVDPAQAAGS